MLDSFFDDSVEEVLLEEVLLEELPASLVAGLRLSVR